MFASNASVGYLRRCIDYRSVLGEVIRKHLGATQNQLNRIIPGYAVTGEHLLSGGTGLDGRWTGTGCPKPWPCQKAPSA